MLMLNFGCDEMTFWHRKFNFTEIFGLSQSNIEWIPNSKYTTQ